MPLKWVRWLFLIAGIYDLGIGAAFLLWGPGLFEATGTPPPNHWGYVQFAALMLAIFGLMFFAVAASPLKNRNLIPYGVLLKASYSGTVFYYWFTTDLRWLFKPFAVIDGVMLVLFLAAYLALGRGQK